MRRAGVVGVLLVAVSAAAATDSPRAALDPIRETIEHGRAVEAIRALEALHERSESSAESHYLLGLAYQLRLDEVGLLSKRGVAGRLRRTLERALELDPQHVGAHEELADFFFFAPGIVGGSDRRAEEQIARLAEVSPYDGHRVRGRHAYSSQEYRAAEQLFAAALALDDSAPRLWYQLANARMQLREKDAEALADYERALARGYDQPVVYYQIGRLCVRLQSCPERGEEVLLHFIANSQGREQAIGRYRLAQLYEQNDRLVEARDQARASVTLEEGIRDVQALLERVERKLQEGS